jgi:hypothetical protein
MFSTPVCEAASSSMMSTSLPLSAARQRSHAPHGSGVGPRSQFRHLAKMRASVVLPVPRGPAKR